MEYFCNNKFYPQNFYLITDNTNELEEKVTEICKEAEEISPESFNGTGRFFKFLLHYCPPYAQDNFRELKRLQEVARFHTRFKDEYKGFILLDVSEWRDHFDEELFAEVTLPFLCDMSDHWKYIFFSSGKAFTESEKRALNKYFKVKCLSGAGTPTIDAHTLLFSRLRNKYDINLSIAAEELFRRAVPSSAMETADVMIAIEQDMQNFFGWHTSIRQEALAEYLSFPDTVCYDLLTEKAGESILHENKEESAL